MLHNLIRITEENNLKPFVGLGTLGAGTWTTYIWVDVPYRCLIDEYLTQRVIRRYDNDSWDCSLTCGTECGK